MMASEETPLLHDPSVDQAILKHNAVYDRFSRRNKIMITAMASFCGLFPLFVSGTFMPVIPAIARDMNSTGPIVSLGVSISIFAASIGSLFGAAYSTFYGRRPIYLVALPVLILGSIGVASSRNILQLLTMRFLQALGSSPGLAVGAGAIADIYRLESRGTAMGVFFAAILLGPALAPFLGGIIAEYYSWRIMQLWLGLSGVVALVGMIFFFPETSHPGARGIDKWREQAGGARFKFVFVNPLQTLALLKSPNLMATSISGLCILITDYVLLTPLAFTFGKSYGITNQALIGLCYMPIGLGNLIGAPLAGRLSDYIVVTYRAKRGGIWYPEDRLRATLIGAGVFVPLSVLCSGLLTQFMPTRLGLILNLICLFMNGLGVDIVLSPSAAYGVDIFHSRSAESMAANNGLRAFLMSFMIAGILPSIELIGVAATNTLAAVVAWLGFLLLLLTIRYGEQMRGWVQMDYSTAENN
ncbi:major facilitator superfamily domain-containing protein [Mycena floridula]|nr:major facilitator superfamily domain-containing protein [Mycena floridula]